MRVGVIARGEDRGLGIQTWEVARHLQPSSTLLVELTAGLGRGFEVHADRFPGAIRVGFDGHRFDDIDTVQDFIRSVDVIYTAETPYDWRMCGWCRMAGVALVVQTNPELHRLVAARDGEEPAVWWNPTHWLDDLLTDPAWTVAPVEYVPMPVALDRFPPPDLASPVDDPVFLHIAGHPAAGDRNGTQTVARALRRVPTGQRWLIRYQGDVPPRMPWDRITADLVVEPATANYWDLYAGAHVLVMPRKYGGQSLPVHEAAAAGLALVMPDVDPNRRWPIVPFLAGRTSPMNRRGVPICAPDFVDMYTVTGRLAADPDRLREARVAARGWAEAHSWDALRATWISRLAAATDP